MIDEEKRITDAHKISNALSLIDGLKHHWEMDKACHTIGYLWINIRMIESTLRSVRK